MKENIEKYIELMYSEESPLNKIENLENRKKSAAEQSGLDHDNDSHIKIMSLKDEIVNIKIFDFINKNNSNRYIQLISDQQLFWDIQIRKMQPLAEGKDIDEDMILKNINLKTTISRTADELRERIEKMYTLIYKNEETKDMAEKQVRLMSPEQRLKKQA